MEVRVGVGMGREVRDLVFWGMLKMCMRMLAQAVTKLRAGRSSLSQTRNPSSPFLATWVDSEVR